MKDAVHVLFKLAIDLNDFYCITIYENEIWLQGLQSEKTIVTYPDAMVNTNREVGYLYKEWKIENISIQLILTPPIL